MAENTGWIVTNIDKITHTLDANHLKIGGGNFILNLTDPNGVLHTISAFGVASGLTSKIAGATKADGKGLGGGQMDYKAIGMAEPENILKDFLKYYNIAKISNQNPEIHYADTFVNRFFNDSNLRPIPKVKSFLACSLNLFSLKVKGTFGISIEGSLDIYTFIAGHHFVPSMTAYYFIVISGEIPILDIFKGAMAFGKSEKIFGYEISFVQYYCPFIGMDSTTASAHIKNSWEEFWNPPGFEKQPMISPP